MKKNYLLLAAWLLFLLPAFSQNIAINADASMPNANAILDIKSGNKGLLIPRMNTTARNAIPNTKGLLVYDTTTNSFWYNTGAQWQAIASDASSLASFSVADSAWLINGNSNVHDTVNFLGTINNVPLNIRVNNQRSGRIDPTRADTYWGYRAGASDTGNNNTANGYQALRSNTSGNFNTAVGSGSLFSNVDGFVNTAYGFQSLYANTSGYRNTAVGTNALHSNTTGTNNTANGYQALYSSTTGINNVANGFQALFSNINGVTNTAIGYQSMFSNTSGYANAATGISSLYGNTTGYYNTANGSASLSANTTGFENTADGSSALWTSTTGNQNTASGASTLFNNITGSENTANGAYSLYSNKGSGNTASGASALYSNVTGSNNTALGFQADVSSGGLTNATAIGNGAIVDASNKVRIGNAAVTVIEGQVPFTTPSDGRFKFNVQENVSGLDFILHLRPVTYQFDTRKFDAQLNHQTKTASPANYAIQASYDESSRIRRSGFIAQEVEKAADVAGYDFSGIIRPKSDQDHYSLSYDAFVVPLVKAVQEQQQLIRQQDIKMASQDKKIADLEQELREIKELLQHAK